MKQRVGFFCHKSSILWISTSEVVLFLFKLSYHEIIDMNNIPIFKLYGDLNQASWIDNHCRNFFWCPRFYGKGCNLGRVDLGRTVRSQDFLLDVRSKGLLNHFLSSSLWARSEIQVQFTSIQVSLAVVTNSWVFPLIVFLFSSSFLWSFRL